MRRPANPDDGLFVGDVALGGAQHADRTGIDQRPVAQPPGVFIDRLVEDFAGGGTGAEAVDLAPELVAMGIEIGEGGDAAIVDVVRHGQRHLRAGHVGRQAGNAAVGFQRPQHRVLRRQPGAQEDIHVAGIEPLVDHLQADVLRLAFIAQRRQQLPGDFGLHRDAGPGRHAEVDLLVCRHGGARAHQGETGSCDQAGGQRQGGNRHRSFHLLSPVVPSIGVSRSAKADNLAEMHRDTRRKAARS